MAFTASGISPLPVRSHSCLTLGIMLSVITRSLRDIRKWLPDARLSNLRLFPESSDKILVEQVLGRTDLKGQFVLGYGAGLRAGEVVRLRVGDIDSAQNIIRIVQAKGRPMLLIAISIS